FLRSKLAFANTPSNANARVRIRDLSLWCMKVAGVTLVHRRSLHREQIRRPKKCRVRLASLVTRQGVTGMKITTVLQTLSDNQLIESISRLVVKEREVLYRVLVHLVEIEHRALHVKR